jgi:hypothetical protein
MKLVGRMGLLIFPTGFDIIDYYSFLPHPLMLPYLYIVHCRLGIPNMSTSTPAQTTFQLMQRYAACIHEPRQLVYYSRNISMPSVSLSIIRAFSIPN